MRLRKLLVSAATGCLLLGASAAMAQVAWLVVGVNSSSGTVSVTSDSCMPAAGELRNQGFTFKGATQIELQLTALYFESSNDAATLFCFAEAV